jgi:hypothetical protein
MEKSYEDKTWVEKADELVEGVELDELDNKYGRASNQGLKIGAGFIICLAACMIMYFALELCGCI